MMPLPDPKPTPQSVSQQERVALHNLLTGPKPWSGRLAGELGVQVKTVQRLTERGLLRLSTDPLDLPMNPDITGIVVKADTRVWVTPMGRVSLAAANQSTSK